MASTPAKLPIRGRASLSPSPRPSSSPVATSIKIRGPGITTLPFTTLDVFTSTRYLGNPLAVVSVPASMGKHALTQAMKQRIAREFNLSETVFLHEPDTTETDTIDIDIFVTDAEIPFAGHPTIGSAYLLLRERRLGHIRALRTKAGEIPIEPQALSEVGAVNAEIPHDVHVHAGTVGDLQPEPQWLSADANIRTAERFAPLVSIVQGMAFLLVELETLDQLAKVRPATTQLVSSGLLDEGDWGQGFVGRYYYVPGEEKDGIVPIRARMVEEVIEDPATGSAASALACYLTMLKAGEGGKSGGSTKYQITQGVEMGRESVIDVEVKLGWDSDGDDIIEQVMLGGTAVVVMKGNIVI
ncbi:uncharacterized protein E0L32_002149 [Thyridium curvatum]|uniref:Uncharacterized protein n=1 Tax=Thyridium curvatum TaxID=1093900 RepID=A0A507AR78_9PEZI|nr:uncharacterized protein E0L32_001984 [Thyridium curvatum]XP_030989257.1 uncharacterized protein E0L32_002149 [Thyridium curvatum]TPX07381.1 hypothetical protein E0L32_001984 [Thyridium curvatum]TPX07546.1 hypothetical protein E0L32_002149 [Thyridium curvatum]